MTRRGACAILSTLVLLAALPARAADDVLKIVPSNALAWGAVHRLAETDAKIQKITGLVGQPVGVLDMIKKEALGAQKGIDDKGTAGFIVLPGKSSDDPPVLVLFVAVTNYKQFLENFKPEKANEKVVEVQIPGSAVLMANRGKYALFTKTADRETLESVLASKKDISAEMAGLDPWLKENDGTLVATAAGIKLFAAKASEEFKRSLDTIQAMGEQPAILKQVFEFYGKVLAATPKEVSQVAIGVRADKEGNIRQLYRLRFVKGRQIDRMLADVKPAQGDLLAGLPKGPFVFAGAGVMSGSMVGPLTDFSVALMKQMPEVYGLSPEQIEKFAKVSTRANSKIHGMGMVMKTGKRNDPMYGNIYGTFRVDDPRQYLADYEKQMQDVNAILKEAKGGMLKPSTVKKIQIGGQPALELGITIPVPKMPNTPGVEAGQQMMDKMFGPGGKMTMYMVAAEGQQVLFGAGVTKEKMAEVLADAKDAKKGLTADPEVKDTAAMLSPGTQGVVYVSLSGYMSLIQRVMMMSMANVENPPDFKLPPFPKCPSVGVGVKAAPGEVQLEVVVPAGVIKAGGEYVNAMRQGFMQPGQPGIP